MITPFEIHVLNYHLDGYGHVNNARYLEFFEAARWDFFRQHQLLKALRQINLVVAQINIRYRHAAQLDDVLIVQTQLVSVQSRQIILHQQITNGQYICVRAEVTLMPTNQNGNVFRLPENVLQSFSKIMETI